MKVNKVLKVFCADNLYTIAGAPINYQFAMTSTNLQTQHDHKTRHKANSNLNVAFNSAWSDIWCQIRSQIRDSRNLGIFQLFWTIPRQRLYKSSHDTIYVCIIRHDLCLLTVQADKPLLRLGMRLEI